MKYNNIVFDGSYFAHKYFYGDAMIFDFIGYMYTIITRFTPDKCFVAWEGDWPLVRSVMYPNYKKKRHEKRNTWEHREKFEKEILKLKTIMSQIGVHQVKASSHEGDDCMFTIAKTYLGNTLIVSIDHDMLQATSPSCHVLNPKTGQIIENDNLRDLTMSIFAGDPTDEVKGIGGIGKKRAELLVNAMPDILDHVIEKNWHTIYSALPEEVHKYVKILEEKYNNILLNYQVMKLRVVTLEVNEPSVNMQPFDFSGLYIQHYARAIIEVLSTKEKTNE